MVQQVTGVWKLVSLRSVRPGGDLTTGWLGLHPGGHLIYHERGHMAVQLVRDPPAAAFDAYYAYFGRFEVDETQRLLRHVVLGSLWPSEVGHTFEHHFRLERDRLVLDGPPFDADGERRRSRMEWARVS